MSSKWTSLMLVSSILATVYSYPTYQSQIPNGQNVMNPCNPQQPWPGVGHENPAGGGTRNPFGIDFGANNHNWATVCPLDSDGDGLTNGQELGDPNCTWTPGSPSPTGSTLSHPGICEPLDSPNCEHKNMWLMCPSSFNCSATHQPDVQNVSIRLTPTLVPANETTYICQGFYLPNDTDYHVIGSTPILNTTSILHHITLFVCRNVPQDMFLEPEQCDMNTGCTEMLTTWSPGVGGACYPEEFGIRIGPNGYKFVIIQIHWNNPTLTANYVDSSGTTLYYTPQLRPYDGDVLSVGPLELAIPGNMPSFSQSGRCSSYCTSALPHGFNITDVSLHMHAIGKSAVLELYRGGRVLSTILSERYDFNKQHFTRLNPPVQVLPGDEMKMTCVYNSTGRNRITYFGPSTSDEMCFALMFYYPSVPYFTDCVTMGTADACTNVPLRCDLATARVLLDGVGVACRYGNCSDECVDTLTNLTRTGCATGDNWKVMLFEMPALRGIAMLMQMCLQPPAPPATKRPSAPRQPPQKKSSKPKRKPRCRGRPVKGGKGGCGN